ncbi:MAG: hypothetical protein ABI785_12495 [Gemmatimonadales bacterium]
MSEAGQRGGCPLGGWAAGQLSRPAWVLLLAMVGCAGPRQNVDPEPVQAAGFSLILNNRHLLDVNIFLQHDGQPDRIATVPSSSTRAIVLPLRMLGQSKAIRIIAEPIGDETRYTTDMLVVQPGQIVEVNVENLIARSSYNIQ